MIAYPSLLVAPAQAAGIPIPEDHQVDTPDAYRQSHCRFYVFVMMQCGRRMPTPDAHYENAKIIAGLSEKEIKTITPHKLEIMGFV